MPFGRGIGAPLSLDEADGVPTRSCWLTGTCCSLRLTRLDSRDYEDKGHDDSPVNVPVDEHPLWFTSFWALSFTNDGVL